MKQKLTIEFENDDGSIYKEEFTDIAIDRLNIGDTGNTTVHTLGGKILPVKIDIELQFKTSDRTIMTTFTKALNRTMPKKKRTTKSQLAKWDKLLKLGG